MLTWESLTISAKTACVRPVRVGLGACHFARTQRPVGADVVRSKPFAVAVGKEGFVVARDVFVVGADLFH